MNYIINDVIDKYGSLIYRISFNYLNNKYDADDVFQDVFLTLNKKKPHFNDEEHLKAWLIKTTINHCKRVITAPWKKRSVELTDTFASNMPPLESDVFLALTSLSKKYRIVLYLYYFEEMNIEEIHRYLNISISNVKVRLHRGRIMMKEILKEDYFDE